MKKISLTILLILFIPLVLGQTTQEEPSDVNTLNKIRQEHANTRKFVSDELTRHEQSFFEQFDDRANYYEETFISTTRNAVWKLGLLWISIMLIHSGMVSFLRLRFDKKHHKRLQQMVREAVKSELQINNVVTQPMIRQENISPNMVINRPIKEEEQQPRRQPQVQQQPPPPPQPKRLSRWQEAKRNIKIKKMKKLVDEYNKLKGQVTK